MHEIVQYLAGLVIPGRTVLVGIDGGAGAGKTTFTEKFANRVREYVKPVSVVLTDLIYRPKADRWKGPPGEMPIGYDLDWERIRDQVILPLRAGKTARFQLYDWVEDRLNKMVEIDVGGVTIVDGVFALRNELSDHYDLRIWFSCRLETRVARLLARGDTPQNEIDYWLPIEERYHAAHTPERSAHIIINSDVNVPADDGFGQLKVVRWIKPETAELP